MNNEVLLRLVIVRNKKIIEAYLDDRLSFKENFVYLEQLAKEDLSHAIIYDPAKKIFLDENIPIREYHIRYFMLLELFG
ncbi:MAG: hypothetical protein IKS69_02705 [Erysipelotrichaceae bacterium]|nr:hypothetical protein [Erysipelotrichaceae bacterium]